MQIFFKNLILQFFVFLLCLAQNSGQQQYEFSELDLLNFDKQLNKFFFKIAENYCKVEEPMKLGFEEFWSILKECIENKQKEHYRFDILLGDYQTLLNLWPDNKFLEFFTEWKKVVSAIDEPQNVSAEPPKRGLPALVRTLTSLGRKKQKHPLHGADTKIKMLIEGIYTFGATLIGHLIVEYRQQETRNPSLEHQINMFVEKQKAYEHIAHSMAGPAESIAAASVQMQSHCHPTNEHVKIYIRPNPDTLLEQMKKFMEKVNNKVCMLYTLKPNLIPNAQLFGKECKQDTIANFAKELADHVPRMIYYWDLNSAFYSTLIVENKLGTATTWFNELRLSLDEHPEVWYSRTLFTFYGIFLISKEMSVKLIRKIVQEQQNDENENGAQKNALLDMLIWMDAIIRELKHSIGEVKPRPKLDNLLKKLEAMGKMPGIVLPMALPNSDGN